MHTGAVQVKNDFLFYFSQVADFNGNFSLQAVSKMRSSRFPTRFLPMPADFCRCRHGADSP
jgi:hypothetical protein